MNSPRQYGMQDGSVFLGVLFLGLILTLAVGAVLLTSANISSSSESTQEDNAVYFAAERCLRRGITRVKYSGLPSPTSASFDDTSNGYVTRMRIQPNGWLSCSTLVTPTVIKPLVWTYRSQCSVQVVVAGTINTLALHKCERTSIPLTYP